MNLSEKLKENNRNFERILGSVQKETSKNIRKILLEFYEMGGPLSQYQIQKSLELAASSTHDIFNKLKVFGWIEKKGSRSSTRGPMGEIELYGFTFKGLLYSIALGVVPPSDAHKVRIKHNIQFPKSSLPFESLVEDLEKDFPEFFYNMIILDKGPEAPDFFISMIPSMAAILTFSHLLSSGSEYVHKYIRGKDLVLSDGTILEDYEGIFRFVNQFPLRSTPTT